jgi:hypothetical protein
MTKPKMLLFDYGQTLVAEAPFDGVKGTAAVMRHAVRNKYGTSGINTGVTSRAQKARDYFPFGILARSISNTSLPMTS